jgi:hypothetical protein
MDVLADATEANLVYAAPAAEETVNEIGSLDVLADATEVSLAYVAPEAEENIAALETERLNVLTDATEASLEYTAPTAIESENAAYEMMLANAK